MKIKSALIKKHRADRLWSQEQLARASGLGLRTIQRLEASGSGSLESIKSLAAVFGIDADMLIWKEAIYKAYKHKQWGFFSISVIVVLVCSIWAINHQYTLLPMMANTVLASLLLCVAIVFSSMTIEVNPSRISWFFGPGVLRKSLALSEVGGYKKVKNPLWMGFGIHAFGTGWIYNVSGLFGVQIELKGGAFIRLGSDEPNYLIQAIDDAKSNIA